jgi:hypothetical protein
VRRSVARRPRAAPVRVCTAISGRAGAESGCIGAVVHGWGRRGDPDYLTHQNRPPLHGSAFDAGRVEEAAAGGGGAGGRRRGAVTPRR